MQARLRVAVLEVSPREEPMPPRKDWREWWTLGGVVTEEGVRTFVRKFQVDRVRLVTLGLLLESPQIQDIPW